MMSLKMSSKGVGLIAATLLMLVMKIQFADAASLPGFNECVLNNHRYAIGEVFHPFVNVNGTEYQAVCLNCTCLPSAISQCEQVICPPVNCPSPIRFSGRCCEICIAPPTLDPSSGKCRYHSLELSNGDRFRPVDRLDNFNSNETERDECIECVCQEGEVDCQDVSNQCPQLPCNDSVSFYPVGECCKKCPETDFPPVHGPGCYDFQGNYILEGETWHPVLPVFGVIECVNCTCVNSQPRCARAECPQVPPCGPNDPIPEYTLCCPQCNSSSIFPVNTTANTTAVPPDSPDLTPCESPYTYEIYTHFYDDTLALLNMVTEMVEVFNWTSMVGPEGPIVTKSFYELTKIEFLQQSNGEFISEGFTIERRVRGLQNKESKRIRIENCTEDCAQMVTSMLRPVSREQALACDG